MRKELKECSYQGLAHGLRLAETFLQKRKPQTHKHELKISLQPGEIIAPWSKQPANPFSGGERKLQGQIQMAFKFLMCSQNNPNTRIWEWFLLHTTCLWVFWEVTFALCLLCSWWIWSWNPEKNNSGGHWGGRWGGLSAGSLLCPCQQHSDWSWCWGCAGEAQEKLVQPFPGGLLTIKWFRLERTLKTL